MPSLINADQLDISPPEWTVDGLIPRVGLGIAHGPSYTGKSLVFDNELALAIANGTEFLGRATVHGSVVVALGEGLYDAGVRLEGRLARQRRDNEEMLAAIEDGEEREAARAALPPYDSERLFIQTQPFTVPVKQDGTPSDSMAHALAQLRVIPDLELLVLDAMSDFSGGLSISNDSSANRYVLGLKMLVRELDCVVLVIGHNTADGKKMIGAQRLFNASDFVIEVIPDDTAPGELKSATLACRKSKYGPEFEPLSYLIEPLEWTTEDEDGEPVLVTSAAVRLQGDAEGGMNVLRLPGNGPSPHRELPEVRPVQQRKKRSGVRSGRSISEQASAIEAAAQQWLDEHPEEPAEPAGPAEPEGEFFSTLLADATASTEEPEAEPEGEPKPGPEPAAAEAVPEPEPEGATA
jgi:hypothetical protein